MSVWILGLLLIVNVVVNVLGSTALKHAAVANSPLHALVGGVCWLIGAGIFVVLLKAQPLSLMAVVTSSLGLIAVVLIGLFVFGETLSVRQWFGIVLAIASLIIISLPGAAS